MSDTLTDIKEACENVSQWGAEYDARMIHAVPDTDVVDRMEFLKLWCRDKVVLSLGCTGQYQEGVDQVATVCYGVDNEPQDREHFACLDLDEEPGVLVYLYPDTELVWAGEVLEHLTNPGRLLKGLALLQCPVLITVPNAHAEVGRLHMQKGIENVNEGHVAYYSYWTLLRLIEKCGFSLLEWHWYGGKPLFAEGLVFVVANKEVEQ